MNNQYITPSNWGERIVDVPKINGISDQLLLAVLFGSTHREAQWRYSPDFIRGLGSYVNVCFNPQDDDWKPSYAEIEALAKHLAAVVVVRLENYDVEMGSMGSMAEIGSAILTGMLKGFKVIISFEDGLIKSLDEDSSATQMYHNLVKQLHELEETFAGGFFSFHHGDDLEELGRMVRNAMIDQENGLVMPLSNEVIAPLLNKRNLKMRKPDSILLTGSGGSFLPSEPFNDYWNSLRTSVSQVWGDSRISNTYSDWMAGMWGSLYHGDIEEKQKVLLIELANNTEQAHKRISTLIITSILKEAGSMGASAEIFLNIIWSLVNSQSMAIYIEEYSPLDHFVEVWFAKHSEDLWDTFGDDLSWRKITKTNRLKNSDIFTSVDANLRVRAVTLAHLKIFAEDESMADLALVIYFNNLSGNAGEDREFFIDDVCGIPNKI